MCPIGANFLKGLLILSSERHTQHNNLFRSAVTRLGLVYDELNWAQEDPLLDMAVNANYSWNAKISLLAGAEQSEESTKNVKKVRIYCSTIFSVCSVAPLQPRNTL